MFAFSTRSTLALTALLTLILTACGSKAFHDPSPVTATKISGPLAVTLRLDRSYTAADTSLSMTLLVVNRSEKPVTVTFPTSQIYDFMVIQDGNQIWQWGAHRSFAQVLTERTYAPGDTVSYTETWDQIDNNATPVPVGTYEAIGELRTTPPIVTPRVEFRVGG